MAKIGYSYGALVDLVTNFFARRDNPHEVKAAQAEAVSNAALGTQVMAENLHINKAGVSGLSLETDTSGVGVRNLAVPDNKDRSIGITNDGKAVVYSKSNGFADILTTRGDPIITGGNGVSVTGNSLNGYIASGDNASTAGRGVVQLSNSTSSDSETMSATSKAVSTLKVRIDNLDDNLGYVVINFGTVLENTRYVETNPFGINTPVIVQAEILLENKWADAGWLFATNSASGVNASYVEGEGIIVQTGSTGVSNRSNFTGGGHGSNVPDIDSAPCRVHVWRVGG